MAEVAENQSVPEGPAQAISRGKRHLVVRDYFNAVTMLAQGCGMLAEEHGDTADELAEPYILYGRALLGLSREEQAVLGTGVPGQEGEDDEEAEEAGEEEPEEAADAAGSAKDDKTEKEEVKEKEEDKTEKKEEDKTEKKEEDKTEKKEEDKEAAADDKEGKEEEKKVEGEEKKEEKKVEEKEAKLSNGDAATASTSSQQNGLPHENGDAQEEEDAEDLENEEDDDSSSNLQLAWEVLELAKIILTKRGEAGHKLLAEAHRLLGEVAMESGNQSSALTDLNACLDLLRNIEPADARSMAETHYQLGLAYALGNEFNSSIEQFQEATTLLETRIKELESLTEPPKQEDDPFYTVEGEIKELKELLPEIQEKITDMRDFKAQACKQLIENIKSHVGGGSCSNGAGPSGASSSSTAGSSSSSAAVSDISHLVRKKRKPEDEAEAEGTGSPCKKPSLVSPSKPV